MSDYAEKYAQCPFFQEVHTRPAIIQCEGVTQTAAQNRMVFDKADGVRRYYRERCCGEYRACPVARVLYEKYEA